MPLQQKIRITEVEDKKKELKSEDLTRSQLLFYVFEDFLRGMFLVGGMILDVLVIFPFIPGTNYAYFVFPSYTGFFDGFPIYLVYAIIMVLTLEAGALYIEVKGWIRFFGRDAMERRYRPVPK